MRYVTQRDQALEEVRRIGQLEREEAKALFNSVMNVAVCPRD